MRFYKLLTLTLFIAVFSSTSCSRASVNQSSSSAGALTANSALENLAARPFGRHNLNVSGFNTLNEFIRPEVRARMDEEPVGDADTGFDPATMEAGREDAQPETPGEAPNQEEAQANPPADEDSYPNAARLDTVKFSWAKKSFGDAVKADVMSGGVIVLYADENYYDTASLMGFIEQGRNRIADQSGIGGERIQVVFGGYRAVPQVELWVVPAGSMPELKPEDRSKANQPEN